MLKIEPATGAQKFFFAIFGQNTPIFILIYVWFPQMGSDRAETPQDDRYWQDVTEYV